MEAVPPVRPAPPVTPAAAAEADVVQEEEEPQTERQSQSEPQSQSDTPTKKRTLITVPPSPGKVTGHVAEMPGILIYTFLQRCKKLYNGDLLPKRN